jgi:hypothetical protein
MDSTSGGLLGSTTTLIVLGIIYKIYKAINHKSININLCGKEWSASVDIDNTEQTNINISKELEIAQKESIINKYDKFEDKYAAQIQNAYRKYKSRRKLKL